MVPSLSEVKQLVNQLALKIQAPQFLLPTYGESLDNAHPYIEIDRSGLLFYLANERGQEVLRYIAKDIDDLLYNIFKDITFSMATKYELSNRVKGQDFRKILFAEQERLLSILSSDWQLRRHIDIKNILLNHPFDDFASIRVDYYKELVTHGKNQGNEWLLACEKYPLPINH
ncbi:MAG TPA: Imm63 family immunity protein [Mucilaginibacter sp.]|nr:Imm63 family immunity protein [Mucilaginibacter sp.]